jgi:hypothetical protein
MPSIKFSVEFDTITAQYPSAVTEVYQARLGGVAAVVLETITVVYTDSTKEFLLSAVRA